MFSKNVLFLFKFCVIEDKVFNYELKRSILDELYELFKLFGKILKEFGNERFGEVFVLDN